MNIQVAKRLSKESFETIDIIAKTLLQESYPSLVKRNTEFGYSSEILLWMERRDMNVYELVGVILNVSTEKLADDILDILEG